MAKKQAPQTETSTNSLCRAVGHDWRSTTSDQYRVCQREQCKMVQRLQHGRWVHVGGERPGSDPLVAYTKTQALPQQTAFFS